MAWQLQEAKQRFSELVRRALEDGPQVVSRHGEDVVVVVPIAEWRAAQPQQDFKAFLRSGPEFEDLDLAADRRLPRDVDL